MIHISSDLKIEGSLYFVWEVSVNSAAYLGEGGLSYGTCTQSQLYFLYNKNMLKSFVHKGQTDYWIQTEY